MRSGGEFKNALREEEPDLRSIITRPEFAIGERAFLLQTPEGNALWDCITYIDHDTVNAVKRLGGLKFIAISHPHYYTSMNEWGHAFGVPIYIHELDRRWVMNPSPEIVFWKGESTPTSLEGVTLVNLGGHFDGGTVLHWASGAGGRGAVLSGDIIQVVSDRRWASFMYSYPNLIPLSEEKVKQISDRIAKFRFDRVYSAFEGREMKRDGYEAVQRSASRYIQHVRGRTITEALA
jgi:glyoxylase-like metal-dependent hydrolase (beta-lactamase superfamily II)